MRSTILGSKTLAVLAIFALTLTTLAGDKNPVSRPVKLKADVAFIVSLDPATLGEAVGISEGEGSHVGKFVINTAGAFDFETGDFVGEGVMTAANGDLLYFKMRSLEQVEFIGGTGRFENATGGYVIEPTTSIEQRTVGGQLIVSFSYTGQGTITCQGSAGSSTRLGPPRGRRATEHQSDRSNAAGSRRWDEIRASR